MAYSENSHSSVLVDLGCRWNKQTVLKRYGTYRGKEEWLITKPDNCGKPGIPLYSFFFSLISAPWRRVPPPCVSVSVSVFPFSFVGSLHRFMRSAVYRDQVWDFVRRDVVERDEYS